MLRSLVLFFYISILVISGHIFFASEELIANVILGLLIELLGHPAIPLLLIILRFPSLLSLLHCRILIFHLCIAHLGMVILALIGALGTLQVDIDILVLLFKLPLFLSEVHELGVLQSSIIQVVIE